MSIRKITEAEEKEIIEFYTAPNSMTRTCKVFRRHTEFILKLLKKYNIAEHSQEVNHELMLKYRYETNLQKYGHKNVGQFGSEENKKAVQEKYNVDNVFQAEEIKEKIKETILEQYGVENISQAEWVKEKVKNTSLERFGVENYTQTEEYKQYMKKDNKEEFQQRRSEFLIERYGTDNLMLTDWMKEKLKSTFLEKYGVEYPSQIPSVRESKKITWSNKSEEEIADSIKKRKCTCIEKYNDENYSNREQSNKTFNTHKLTVLGFVDNIISKSIKTCNEKYGTDWYTQTSEYHSKAVKRYKVTNISFDSFPELAFYLYNINNNVSIERCPIKLEYVFTDEQHYYFPDFKVNNSLVELKGDQFLTEAGKWCCPYDHSQDTVFEAKHQCAIKNNVIILYKADYQKYIDWFYQQGYKKEDFLSK